jgi:uncharacterized membrane protein YcaP (DUF421 family)
MFTENEILNVVLKASVLTTITMLWVVLLVRINGLRSFSKMTNFDFVMTVGIGSLLASSSQSQTWMAFVQGLLAMAMLFVVQYFAAKLRKHSDTAENIIQNQPRILVRDGIILEDALRETRVSRSDLLAKLREANVLHFTEVRAVILETTGDISVLHGDSISPEILGGIN